MTFNYKSSIPFLPTFDYKFSVNIYKFINFINECAPCLSGMNCLNVEGGLLCTTVVRDVVKGWGRGIRLLCGWVVWHWDEEKVSGGKYKGRENFLYPN